MARTRRIVMFNQLSADGYFAAPDGGLDWVVPDEEMQQTALEGMAVIDTVLFGRRTYEQFASYWPHVADGASTLADPHGGGPPSAATRAMGRWFTDTHKVVFSRTLTSAAWRNTRIVPEIDPAAIAGMKRQPGNDLMIFGSGSVVSQLTVHDLIDEYMLLICPVLLGGGRSLLSGLPAPVRLALAESTAHRSGNVMQRYVRAR